MSTLKRAAVTAVVSSGALIAAAQNALAGVTWK